MNRTFADRVLVLYAMNMEAAVRTVRTDPVTGLIAGLTGQAALLATLAGTVGLGVSGWLVGLACGLVTNTTVAHGLTRSGMGAAGPADRVTLTRAILAGGVAALVADAFVRPAHVGALVALAVLALVLDAVDGWVARRTGTVSAFGARFDMEVDAFLIFVLSVYVARSVGPWVLVIGAARYASLAAGRLLPWLREAVPRRYWGKLVAAVQGVVLTVAAANLVPAPAIDVALLAALALLAESFGHDAWWLWHHRPLHATRRAEQRRIVVAGSTGRGRSLALAYAEQCAAPAPADGMLRSG
jgi:phosphatidylglycerophosphate synthase